MAVTLTVLSSLLTNWSRNLVLIPKELVNLIFKFQQFYIFFDLYDKNDIKITRQNNKLSIQYNCENRHYQNYISCTKPIKSYIIINVIKFCDVTGSMGKFEYIKYIYTDILLCFRNILYRIYYSSNR